MPTTPLKVPHKQPTNSLEYMEAFLSCNAVTRLHVTAFKEFDPIIFTFCIFNESKKSIDKVYLF